MWVCDSCPAHRCRSGTSSCSAAGAYPCKEVWLAGFTTCTQTRQSASGCHSRRCMVWAAILLRQEAQACRLRQAHVAVQGVDGVPCLWHCHPEIAERYSLPLDVPDELAEEISKAAKRRAQAARKARAERAAPPAAPQVRLWVAAAAHMPLASQASIRQQQAKLACPGCACSTT